VRKHFGGKEVLGALNLYRPATGWSNTTDDAHVSNLVL
jgi:hypothetical protein